MKLNEIFKTRLEKLNKAQFKAVNTIDGPVLVIAGPGSGKTEILSLRAANILKKTDTIPSSILCLTFTDNASANMRRRLSGLIGKEAYKVAIHTFHSFGKEIIEQYPEYFYNGAIFNPADELTQVEILEEIIKNLGHKYELKTTHVESGFVYLKDAQKRIEELKKAGISPKEFLKIIEENEEYFKQANPLVNEALSSTVSKKNFPIYENLITELENIPYNLEKNSLKDTLVKSLTEAVNSALEENSTKPVTAWKKEFIENDRNKNKILKDSKYSQKFKELAEVYDKYQNEMHSQGYFDFADMILDTVSAMEANSDLRFNLQEKYQYILVDEFQDTNGVQMALLEHLLDAEVNEGRPNIMAVGDDDQAIYKFQGAQVGNIMEFHDKYRDPALIVLDKNYRSNKGIVEYERQIILKGKDRLENLMPDKINKELKAANSAIEDGKIEELEFNSEIDEYIWIAKKINDLISKGEDASEIAIINKKHKHLEQIANILDMHNIPVKYQRKNNVLEERYIIEILTILKFIDTLCNKNQLAADEYLPEILSYPFLNLESIEIWKLSISAYKEKKLWLELMLESEKEELKGLAKFFIDLGAAAKTLTAEQIIDYITGIEPLNEYRSNYYNYYFKEEERHIASNEYMEFLSNLQKLFEAVRTHKGGKGLSIGELIKFTDTLKDHDLKIENKEEVNLGEKAVNLHTAHSAKGLEFKTVFITNCTDDCWLKGGYRDKLKLPKNLPLSPKAENEDDQLRLFFVAVSRAKCNAYLTHAKVKENGKELLKIRFLEGESTPAEISSKDLEDKLNTKAQLHKYVLINIDQQAFLKSRLQEYKMSVTHLNNFIDLQYGGPELFLENNLLRFPQMQSKESAYGSAIHYAMDLFYKEFKSTGSLPSLDELIKFFEIGLKNQRLNKRDFEELLEKGNDNLTIYYSNRADAFNINHLTEYNFVHEGIMIGEVPVTGKIDRMGIDKDSKMVEVVDYKTGKPLNSWDSSRPNDKIKLLKNRNQLVFYKLLVENSRTFGQKYKVNRGMLEFMNPGHDNEIYILTTDISDEDAANLKKLVQKVYEKIKNLDFPDTSMYSQDIIGTELFISDLIHDNI
ncbi:AAA family ATPase [Candidatus Peregrinibacteria bacterium]|nr:AAA family ATPase [Candidatus Peregrinibacteria bacterium]